MKREVVCIKKSDKFKHHQKLMVGNKYLLEDNVNTISIYDLGRERLGCYPREFFINVEEYRVSRNPT